MDREAQVLQDRVHAPAVKRRRRQAQERVRGEEDESEEAGADHALDREHARAQVRRQAGTEPGHGRAEQRQDQHPQDHRAFVVRPHTGDLVEERLGGVAVLRHGRQREIRGDVGVRERHEGQRHQRELSDRGAAGERHQRGIAARGAVERHHRLHDRQHQRQGESEMAELGDHGLACAASAEGCSPCQCPAFLSASATSGGM